MKGGDDWRSRVRGYFIGCCPALKPLLQWAESHDGQSFTLSDLREAQRQHVFMIEEDAEVLSGHLWRFLRSCLQDSASGILDSVAEDLNGLEV